MTGRHAAVGRYREYEIFGVKPDLSADVWRAAAMDESTLFRQAAVEEVVSEVEENEGLQRILVCLGRNELQTVIRAMVNVADRALEAGGDDARRDLAKQLSNLLTVR